jgi:hypothetical protein
MRRVSAIAQDALKIIQERGAGVGSAQVLGILAYGSRSRSRSRRWGALGPRFQAHVALASCAGAGALLLAGSAAADPSTVAPEQGYDVGSIQSPRDLAFGGAQNALGSSTTALYGNPGGLPLARVYHFEGIATLAPEARRQSYGGAVVDSSTSRLAGGLGGTWNMLDPDGIHRTWTDLRLVLAYPLGDRFAVGASGRYLRTAQNPGTGPLGASLASDAANPLFNAFTFDVGATAVPATGVRVGLVGHNLTNPGTALAPTMLAGGVGYQNDTFSLEGDAQADFTTWKATRGRYMLGGELFLASHFPIRLGYRYDDGLKTHAVSGGLGYIDRRWSFEMSVRRDVVGEHPMTMISAGLRIFYDAVKSGDGEGGPDQF